MRVPMIRSRFARDSILCSEICPVRVVLKFVLFWGLGCVLCFCGGGGCRRARERETERRGGLRVFNKRLFVLTRVCRCHVVQGFGGGDKDRAESV